MVLRSALVACLLAGAASADEIPRRGDNMKRSYMHGLPIFPSIGVRVDF